ncbi:MAG: ABC transporter substrate-binding protein, partial [Alphaproteobacteria bacterium]
TVQRVQTPNSPAGMALIAQGRIDGYIVSAGVPVALKAANERFLAWNTDDIAPIPGQCYIAKRESVARDGDLVVRFLRAVKKSIDDMLADTDLATTIKRIEGFEIGEMRNRAVAPDILRNEMQFWLTAGRSNVLRHVPERWQRGYDLMAAAGFTPPGQADRLYTNEFIDKAIA